MSGTYDRDKRKGQINPAVSYNFGLQVEAMFFVPLRAVRVFTKENEFDYYQEGGMNDFVHMLRKPISKPFTFQVEKYVGTDSGMFDQNSGFVDPLALGTDLILPIVLFVNRAQTKNAGENFSYQIPGWEYLQGTPGTRGGDPDPLHPEAEHGHPVPARGEQNSAVYGHRQPEAGEGGYPGPAAAGFPRSGEADEGRQRGRPDHLLEPVQGWHPPLRAFPAGHCGRRGGIHPL